MTQRQNQPNGTMRYGWTTGACATAATAAAYTALLSGEFPDPVTITLPRGQTPSFALTKHQRVDDRSARATITKDAGDDPDVTHGALITSTVTLIGGDDVVFEAGDGVGIVTKPGLPVAVGEPAINPVPRKMMRDHVAEIGHRLGHPGGVRIEVSIEHGADLAQHTWNPRLGIVGGLSVLGTTGIVVPYSCSAWIDSIRRGVDVARATGLTHVGAATGTTSEATVRALYGLDEGAMLDMGDFAGAVLKYIKVHPVPRLTVAGGFAKMSKLAAGHLDLHSGRSSINLDFVATFVNDGELHDLLASANSALHAWEIARDHGVPLADRVAAAALETCRGVLGSAPVEVDLVVINRAGDIIGRAS